MYIGHHYLLTGAGFSRNWGGLLASEVFEYLLGRLETDDDLRELLWSEKKLNRAFEDTLATLQAQYEVDGPGRTEQNLRNLTSAIYRMFGDMQQGFVYMPFEPFENMDADKGTRMFLAKFDAIFTLNQDTLLETHYFPNVFANSFPKTLFGPTFRGAYRPGIVEAYDTLSNGAQRIDLYKVGDLVEDPDLQPYFKLHGSADLKAGDREMTLILGGNKAQNIGKHPILQWYQQEFRRRLHAPDSRLIVIGYSFGDPHINEIIVSAVESGLKVFIIDVAGADVISNREAGKLGTTANYDLVRKSIVGASRRPLLPSLAGQDMVEYHKIHRFFKTTTIAVTHSNR